MRALVTGNLGFIGGHLKAELERQGCEVAGADIKASLDLSWPDELRGLPDVDIVYHLAAFTGVRASVKDPLTCMRWNVLGTQNILDWCVKRGVSKLVFASSSSVYGDGPTPFNEDQTLRPMSPYAASKVAGEALCQTAHRLYGLDVAVIRPFTVYGPNGRKDMAVRRFIEAMREGRPLTVYGYGGQRRDFTFIDDVVRVFLAAATWSGWTVVNAGAGEPHSVGYLVQELERLFGRKAEIDMRDRNAADVSATWADTTRLTKLMGGWKPVSFAEGLKRTLE